MPVETVQLYETKDFINKRYKKRCRLELPSGDGIVCYYPFKSIQILFYDIRSPKIPDLYDWGYRKPTNERYLRTFFCRNGSCEFSLDNKTDKLSAGQVMIDFSVGDNGKFSFSSSYFRGVEIIIQLDSFDKESTLYRKFKPVIKGMKLPEKEMFTSDNYISSYSSKTEKRLELFISDGFDGLDNITLVGNLIVLARSLGEDLREKPSKLTDSQLIIARDIYDCLTNHVEEKWTAQ